MKTYVNIVATIFAIGLSAAFILGPCTIAYEGYKKWGFSEQFAAGLMLTMIYFFVLNVVWFSVVKAWRENITFGAALYKLI